MQTFMQAITSASPRLNILFIQFNGAPSIDAETKAERERERERERNTSYNIYLCIRNNKADDPQKE